MRRRGRPRNSARARNGANSCFEGNALDDSPDVVRKHLGSPSGHQQWAVQATETFRRQVYRASLRVVVMNSRYNRERASASERLAHANSKLLAAVCKVDVADRQRPCLLHAYAREPKQGHKDVLVGCSEAFEKSLVFLRLQPVDCLCLDTRRLNQRSDVACGSTILINELVESVKEGEERLQRRDLRAIGASRRAPQPLLEGVVPAAPAPSISPRPSEPGLRAPAQLSKEARSSRYSRRVPTERPVLARYPSKALSSCRNRDVSLSLIYVILS